MTNSTVSTVITENSSLTSNSIQETPKSSGLLGRIKFFFGLFKEIWDDMNRPLTEEEKKELDLYLKNRPYDAFGYWDSPFNRPFGYWNDPFNHF
jgi:hypothetical protein